MMSNLLLFQINQIFKLILFFIKFEEKIYQTVETMNELNILIKTPAGPLCINIIIL